MNAVASAAMTGILAQTEYETGGEALGVFMLVFALLYVAMAVLGIVAMVKILHKAGYSGWWALTMFVPLLNIVMFLVFAFADWPVVRAARRAHQPVPYYPQQPYGG